MQIPVSNPSSVDSAGSSVSQSQVLLGDVHLSLGDPPSATPAAEDVRASEIQTGDIEERLPQEHIVDIDLSQECGPGISKDSGHSSAGTPREHPTISLGHPLLRVVLSPLPLSSCETEEHKSALRDVNALIKGTAMLNKHVDRLETACDLTARVVGLSADMGESNPPADGSTITSLITANNKHTTNSLTMGLAIKDILARVRKAEEFSADISSLQATVDAHQRALGVVLNRASASTGTAPPLLSDEDAALIASSTEGRLRTLVREMLVNANGKRGRPDADEDERTKRRDSRYVAYPPSFTYSRTTFPLEGGFTAEGSSSLSK
ncbi:hypothetical protein C8R47DRAFT_1066109 [Mycena vitilis]|nr:hypothetical protein C8R47DRAFT_1066109 [Mycena vitilis]